MTPSCKPYRGHGGRGREFILGSFSWGGHSDDLGSELSDGLRRVVIAGFVVRIVDGNNELLDSHGEGKKSVLL